MKLVYLITEQKTSQAVKRKNSLFNWEPFEGGWEQGRVCAVPVRNNLSLALGGRVSALA